MRLCSQFARAAASDKFNRKNFRSFRALPAPDSSLKKKESLKLYFYRKLQLLSFLLIPFIVRFLVKLAPVRICSRRTPAKVGSNLNTIFRIMAVVSLLTLQPHFITIPGHPLQVYSNCMQKGFVDCRTRTSRFMITCLEYEPYIIYLLQLQWNLHSEDTLGLGQMSPT